MARAKIGVEFDPVVTAKVDRELARLQAQAKGIDFGGGARSLNKLSRPLGKITGQANEFQKSLEASNARVLAFGASVVVINKLSQAFGALVSNTIKVEATFAKINTILGGTQAQLKQFGDGIFQVAKNTATSFDDVAEGALELARQGLSVEESLGRVEVALKLVRVAGIDSQKAVAGLTAAIKGFESAGLTVAQIGDKLAQVDTKFAVSTEDLINGLERASASARVAGVSFDELLAAVTTVQERTQRGGAVIGNAFKTIFARLGRTDTLVALEELGIQVLDTEGNVRDAIPLFRELARELDEMGIRSTKAGDIIQKVAGVRQRDILINLVEDLNSEFSKFDQAIGVAENSIGSLDQKNQKLNETLDALIKNLVTSGQQLAATLGNVGFLDAAKGIVDGFSAVVNKITEVLDGEGIGSKFARGLVAGIGSILTGPGLGLALAIFTKLFIDLAKFGVQSLKSLLGINAATERQNALQQSVLQSLLQNEALQASLLKLGSDKAAQEQLLLRVYQQQVAAMQRLSAISKTVTPGLYGKGLRGGPEGITGKASGGYIASERRDVNRGVGGATSAAQVVSIPNFAFGGGKRGTMIANTSEYIVPNYAGGGDAIFNQNMVKSMGLPPGARKITAAGGFIPNFKSIANMTMSDVTRSLEAKRMLNPTDPRLRNEKAQLLMRQRQLNKGKKFPDVPVGRFAMIVPQHGVKQVIKGARGSSNEGLNYTVAGFKGLDAVKRGVRNDEQLDDELRQMAVKMAIRESKAISGNRPKPGAIRELANKGASSGLAGAIFETSVSSLLDSKDFDVNIDPNRRFDYAGGMGIDKLFNVPLNAAYIEAKLRNSPDQRTSMFGKMKKQLGRSASGYIPNYADPLSDAIGREMGAGVPINQIRINQSGKLRNSSNPMGIAVTNTRDEPTGAIPNFAGPLALLAPMLISTIASVVVPVVVDKAMKYMTSRKMVGPMKQGQARPRVGGRGIGTGMAGTLSTLAFMAPSFFTAFGQDPTIDMDVGELPSTTEQLNKARATKEATQNRIKELQEGKQTETTTQQAIAEALKRTDLSNDTMAELRNSMVESQRRSADITNSILKEQASLEDVNKIIGDLSTEREATRSLTMAEAITKGEAKASVITKFGTKTRAIQPGTVGAAGGFGGGSVAEAKALLQLNKELTNVQKVNLQFEIDKAGITEQVTKQRITDLKTIANSAIEGKKLGEIEKEKFNTLIDSVDANTDYLEFTKDITDLLSDTGDYTEEQIKEIVSQALALEATNKNMGEDLQHNLDLRKAENDAIAEGTDKLNDRINAQRRAFEAASDTISITQLGIDLDRVKGQDLVGRDARKLNVDLIERQADLDESAVTNKFTKLQNEAKNQLIDLQAIEESVRTQGQIDEIAHLQNRLEYLGKAKELEIDIIEAKEEYDKRMAGMTPLEQYADQKRKEVKVFADELPARMAANFEQGMNNALDGLADGTYDTLGEALGNVAIQFGNDLLQELRRVAMSDFMKAITSGDGAGGSSILSGIGGFIKGLFTGNKDTGGIRKANSGGMITGGSGVVDDVPALLTGGEYVIKKSAVQKYGQGFLNSLNAGVLPAFNNGGPVTHEAQRVAADGSLQGGDNIRTTEFFMYQGEGLFGRDHDRKADLSQMFGGAASNERLERARGMDFFMPGDRGAGGIIGKENLLAFSQQMMTSGTTDEVSQGRINLELQSARLSPLGRHLARQSPAGQRLVEAQGQAYNLAMQSAAEEQRVVDENQQARTARREALQSAIKSAAINAVVTAGVQAAAQGLQNMQMSNQAANAGATNVGGYEAAPQSVQVQLDAGAKNVMSGDTMYFKDYNPVFGSSNVKPAKTMSIFNYGSDSDSDRRNALGGIMGGTSTGLLTGGEYVVSSEATDAIGKETLDSVNQMTYALGGPVGSVGTGKSSSPSAKSDVENINITINIEKDGSTDATASQEGGQDPEKAKEFSKKVKDVVLNVINEEKRVSGSLFTRTK